MRLSADCNDPGFEPYVRITGRGNRIVVRCDGVELRDCITADSDENVATVVRRSEYDGEIEVDRAAGEVLTDTVRGVIEFEIVPEART